MFDPTGSVLAISKTIMLKNVVPLPRNAALLSAIVGGNDPFWGVVSSYDDTVEMAEVDVVIDFGNALEPRPLIYRLSMELLDPWGGEDAAPVTDDFIMAAIPRSE